MDDDSRMHRCQTDG